MWKKYFFNLSGGMLVYYGDETAFSQGLGLGYMDLTKLSLVQTVGHNVSAGSNVSL